MCGVAGILALGGRPPELEELRAMAAPLRHRGPDGERFWTEGRVGLAHTRLSIIDLEGGAQPIENESGSVRVVFNGEIFNFVELRAELERRGHRFRTRTDTEVLVHLYEDEGLGFLDALNGQFAIALWDATRERLVLARDRPGIIPLFHARRDGRLYFASEVKAILPLIGPPTLDAAALDQILTFWAPVSPRTPFEGVEELPPGHLLVAERGEVTIRRWWDWTFPAEGGPYAEGSAEDLARELWDLLEDATRIRLRADVPVGAYLSGGLDSSALAALVRSDAGDRLRTFSIGFEDAGLDERPYQRAMAEHLGADHSEIVCGHHEIAEAFPETVRATECPVLRTAPTPMGLLSGLAHREGFKVVLTGEGADEVLGGYDLFKEAKVRWFWSKSPGSAWRPNLLQRLYPYLELSSMRAQSYVRDFFGAGLDRPDDPFFAHLPRWTTTAQAKRFLAPDFARAGGTSALEAMRDLVPEAAAGWHRFCRAQYLEAKSLMSGYLLSSQGDRQLMRSSVEGRFPYLDHRVIELANRLDPRLKMRVLDEKHLLKRAARGHVPDRVLSRHKQPYRAPDAAAFFEPGRPVPGYVEELLSEEALRRTGYFEPRSATLLVAKARRGAVQSVRDNQALVGILSTQLWHHIFIDRFRSDFAPQS